MVFSSDFLLGGKNLPFCEKKIFWKNNILSQIPCFLGAKITKNKIFFQKPPKIITIAYDMT
jgi:hypothetical protein